MAVVADAERVLDVARGLLYVADAAVMTASIGTSSQLAACDDRSIALACAGDAMSASVNVEHHDQPPPSLAGPWVTAVHRARMDLPTGELFLANLDGGEALLLGVGLAAGRWHVDVHVSGRDDALTLQAQMDAAFEQGALDVDPAVSPERWLVRFWR